MYLSVIDLVYRPDLHYVQKASPSALAIVSVSYRMASDSVSFLRPRSCSRKKETAPVQKSLGCSSS